MQNTKTLLFIMLGVLLVSAGIIYFSLFFTVGNSGVGDEPNPSDTTQMNFPLDRVEIDTTIKDKEKYPPEILALLQSIDKLRGEAWDKDNFESLQFKVTNASDRKLIDDKTETLFNERLVLNYLFTLKKKLDQVIRSSTSLYDLLAPHNELKAMAKRGHRDKVKGHLQKSSAIYVLHNTVKEAKEKISNGEADDEALENYAKEIEAYRKRQEFRNSDLVDELVSSGLKSVVNSWAGELQQQIDNPITSYYEQSQFNADTTDHYLDLLSTISQNRYLTKKKNLSRLIQQQEDLLKQHRDIDRAFETSMSLLGVNDDCEQEFAPFQYYIKKCNEAKENKENE